MAAWPVFVQFWQLECCGEPFAIGQEVAWTLVLVDAETREWPWPGHLLADIDAVVGEPASTDDGRDGFAVLADGVTAWLPGGRPDGGRVHVRGLFLEEHHGGMPYEIPKVRGRVERIRLVKEPFRRVRGNEWEPTAGEWQLEDLQRSPDRFEQGPANGDLMLDETGLLVDLLPL